MVSILDVMSHPTFEKELTAEMNQWTSALKKAKAAGTINARGKAYMDLLSKKPDELCVLFLEVQAKKTHLSSTLRQFLHSFFEPVVRRTVISISKNPKTN